MSKMKKTKEKLLDLKICSRFRINNLPVITTPSILSPGQNHFPLCLNILGCYSIISSLWVNDALIKRSFLKV